MAVLVLTGGLGNQMFEYAFALALRDRGYAVKLDVSLYSFAQMHNGYELNHIFGIQARLINRHGPHVLWLRFLHKVKPSCVYMDDGHNNISACLTRPRKYIWGYWQNERYFKDIETCVRRSFTFRDIDNVNLVIAHEMKGCCSVALHLRRGDYAAFGMTLLNEEYYRKAVEYMRDAVGAPSFYIFSDDAAAAKCLAEEVCGGGSYRLITHNRGADSYKDMFLMSQCRHNIIANSSFSWWGAWLNENPDKIVVAPSMWDIKHPEFHPQPESWVLI